jgi:hypothetical protein
MSVRVRLTRKLAPIINGIDLSHTKLGEEIELAANEAALLIAEGWAAAVERVKETDRRRKGKNSASSVRS